MSNIKFSDHITEDDPWFYKDPWKEEFIRKFGCDEWVKLQRQKDKIVQRHIQRLVEEYERTGSKTPLQMLKKLYHVDAD